MTSQQGVEAQNQTQPQQESGKGRLRGIGYWVVLTLGGLGLLMAINQTFNLKILGFEPLGNSYLYYLIGIFLAASFLCFPAWPGARNRIAWYDWVLAVAALIGWMMIPVVFGEGFRQAREVLVVLTVAELVLTLHFMYQALLVGFGRPSGIGLPSVVGAVVMVALNLAMIPAWGMQGAAWACLLGFGALAAISAGWTNRELRRIG